MGLLDTKAMKFLFGGTDYMRNKRSDEMGSRVQGIIGQPGQSIGNGPMQPQGLLGQNPTPEQFSTQLGQQLMGIPGYQNQGVDLINQMTANRQSGANNMNTVQGAYDRQLQEQDFSMNNLTADQGRQQSNTDRAFFQGQSNVDRAYLTEQVKQSSQNLEIGNQLLESLPKVGGTNVVNYSEMNATQDNQMLMAFAKVINPGEAVGVDEKGAIQGASWMPDFLMQGIAALESGGQMPATLRQQIFAQYTQALQSNQDKINQLRQMNSGASGDVYSPGSQDYSGMYEGGQVGNNNLFNGDSSGRTRLPVVTDKSLIKRLFGG